MQQSIRDKVTDLIFKARLTPQAAQRQRPEGRATQPAPAPAMAGAVGTARAPRRPVQPAQPAIAAAAAAVAGTASQRRDLEAADRAGTGGARAKRVPIRTSPTVGRNEPCPCGSGKKYKKCCGQKR